MKVYVLFIKPAAMSEHLNIIVRYKVCDYLRQAVVCAKRMHKNGLITDAWICEGSLTLQPKAIKPLEQTGYRPYIYKTFGD